MAIIRRFNFMPPVDQLTDIESVNIIDRTPPSVRVGTGKGCVLLCGEWPKGPFNKPVAAIGPSTVLDDFGGFSLSTVDPLSFSSNKWTNPFSNGCGYAWLNRKKFRKLVLVRVDNTLAGGANLKLADTTLAGATGSVTVVAGASLVNGETLTIPDGNPNHTPTVLEFRSSGSPSAGHVAVAFTGGDNVATVAAAVIAALNSVGAASDVSAGSATGAVIPLTNDYGGAHGNVTITDTVANGGFSSAGMTGGVGQRWLTQDMTLPGGTRIRDASATGREYALAQDVRIVAGTDLALAAFDTFDATDLTAGYDSRTVAGVPVTSTKNAAESAPGDVDSVDTVDQFRAGYGAGSTFPSLSWTVSTGAVDGCPANGAALIALTSDQLDARYQDALDSALPGVPEVVDVGVVACARTSNAIRAALIEHAADASSSGPGRAALLRAPIGTLPAAAFGNAAPGAGQNRSDYAIYCYPHHRERLRELADLDPLATISGTLITVGADSDMAVLLSNLPPYENPGQTTSEYVPGGYLKHIEDLEPGLTGAGKPTSFLLDFYKAAKAAGVAALRRDTSEWVFQSGVTTSLIDGRKTIKRRRMASMLQDDLAAIGSGYNKKARTSIRQDALIGETTDYLEDKLSEGKPDFQQIRGYTLDGREKNTEDLQGTGIFILTTRIALLDDFGSIVVETEIGESVVVSARDE